MSCVSEVKRSYVVLRFKKHGCSKNIVWKFLVLENFMWRIVSHTKISLAIGVLQVFSQDYEQIFFRAAFLSMNLVVKTGKMYFKVGEPN